MATSYSTTAIVLLLFLVFPSLSSAALHHRRILDQPFSPQDSSPAPDDTPFFPSYPPPPPPASFYSFPGNLSSLGAKAKSPSSKLIGGAIAAIISAATMVSLSVFLYLHSRSKKKQRSPPINHTKSPRSDTNSVATAFHPVSNAADSVHTSDSRKMNSPELRPLPPLKAQQKFRRHYQNSADVASGKGDEDEEFYYPKVSLDGIESFASTGSASTKDFAAVQVENSNRPSTLNSSSICSSPGWGSPFSPVKSISSSLSPANSLSYRNSIPKSSPHLVVMQAIESLFQGSNSYESASPLPASSSSPEGYESSSAISNVSDYKVSAMTTPPQQPSRDLNIFLSPLPISVPPPPITAPPPPIAVKNPTSISPLELPSNGSRNFEGNKKFPVDEIMRSGEAKLKPLHWDEVRASSDRVMVWDQLKCSSVKLDEEMIETSFVANAAKPTPKGPTRSKVLPSPGQDNVNRVLDPKKAHNIAILLSAFNVTIEEVCEGISEGNTGTLGPELLESLSKMAPTKEEERKLKEDEAVSLTTLGDAERFLKAVLDIPYAFRRVDAMLYVSNFESEADYLKKAFETLEAACEQIRTSRMFLKLLEAVLKTGNRANVGTNRFDANAFKLDTLLKLVDVKGADGKTTLLHFVVQEIIRTEVARFINENATEGSTINNDAKYRNLGLKVVSSLSSELSNVKKAANMDAQVLSSKVSEFSKGIENIGEVIRSNKVFYVEESGTHKFSESMNGFMKRAEEQIFRIRAQESVALSSVKEVTKYFHGNSENEEARPFIIFTVIRDFLTILDRVCEEVGMINEQTVVSSAERFVNPMLQRVTGGFPNKRHYNSC